MATGIAKHVVIEEDGEYIVRNAIAKDGLKAARSDTPTIASLIPLAAEKHPDCDLFGTRPVLSRETTKHPKTGKVLEKLHLGDYEWQTCRRVASRVANLGAGLRRLGVASGDNVTIYMNTRPEWQISAHAAWDMSAVVVTLYSTLGEEAMVYGLRETDTAVVITEASLMGQLRRVASKVPSVRTVVFVGEADGEEDAAEGFPANTKVVKFSGVEVDGEAHPSEPERRPKPDDLAVIMYTSGSTGMPKGVLLTHVNVMAAMRGLCDSFPPMIAGEDTYLAFLPLAHILALVAELLFVSYGCRIGYGAPTTLMDVGGRIKKGTSGDIAALCPTYMACVPTIIDRIRQGVMGMMKASGAAVEKPFWLGFESKARALEADGTSVGYGAYIFGGGILLFIFNVFSIAFDSDLAVALFSGVFVFLGSIILGIVNLGLFSGAINTAIIGFWDLLIFNKFKPALGGRMKGMVSGGAPLSPDSQRFLSVVFGMPCIQGYGLTETCALGTVSDYLNPKAYGCVGIPESTIQYKVIDWEEGGYRVSDRDNKEIGAARGEICFSGPTIAQGYHKLPEKTSEDFRTDSKGVRWFHTGDIGMVHADGNLQIIDRKKDLVKLQQGEYVSLGKVEAVLAAAPGVEQIAVHADPFHSFAVALVVPQKAAFLRALSAEGINVERSWEDVCADPAAEAFMLKGIAETAKQAKLARFEVPQRVTLKHQLWTPESGLVTASLKLQRAKIYKEFADVITATYDK